MYITYWFFHKANGLSKDANWSNGIPKKQCVNATISPTLPFWWGRTLGYEQLKHDLNFFLGRGRVVKNFIVKKNTNGLDARSNVCFLSFVEIRRRAIFKNNVVGWSHTFNSFCSNDFHNLHSDMEVHKRNRNEILSSVYHQWNNELLFFFQIYKKWPKYNDVKPLCIFSVGLRCLHFVCRTNRLWGTSVNIYKNYHMCNKLKQD